MTTFNKLCLVLYLGMAISPVVAQQEFLIDHAPKITNETYAQKVRLAGQLTATAQAADGGYVTVSKIDNRSFLVRRINESAQKRWEKRLNFRVDDGAFRVFIHATTQTKDGGFVLAGDLGSAAFWDYDDDYMISAALVKLRPLRTVSVDATTFS